MAVAGSLLGSRGSQYSKEPSTEQGWPVLHERALFSETICGELRTFTCTHPALFLQGLCLLESVWLEEPPWSRSPPPTLSLCQACCGVTCQHVCSSISEHRRGLDSTPRTFVSLDLWHKCCIYSETCKLDIRLIEAGLLLSQNCKMSRKLRCVMYLSQHPMMSVIIMYCKYALTTTE